MTTPSSDPKPANRERISCPGCGRHDWVSWPPGNVTYHWKCFNCEKQFDLQRASKH